MVRSALRDFLRIADFQGPVPFSESDEWRGEGFRRVRIEYRGSEDDVIPAYLFVPLIAGPHPAVLVHHQHNGEWHYGKSEVAGLSGDPLQAFGPVLASRGFVVLAPDSLCFEDRRPNRSGTTRGDGDSDRLQHYNQMASRLVRGASLMKKVLDDASIGLSVLSHLPYVDPVRIGVLGHSYGGNTALFQAAVDERLSFVCTSGAVCSYSRKAQDGTGLEMALVIPDFCSRFEISDLLAAIAPRKVLVVSATEDKYSKDADEVVGAAMPAFSSIGAETQLSHHRYDGQHPLTHERFDRIVEWIVEQRGI